MLFTNYRFLISSDPTGLELKTLGDFANQRWDYYFSYLQDGTPIRYFLVPTKRTRNFLPYMQGNVNNTSKYTIFKVTDFFIKQYIKYGKIGKVNIQLNTKKIISSEIYKKLYFDMFGIKVGRKSLSIKREGYKVIFDYEFYSKHYVIELQTGLYKVYIEGIEVEIPEKIVRLLDCFLVNIHNPKKYK